MKSGSQAGPGLYFAIPFAQWNADSIKDADGRTVLGTQFQGFDVRAVFPTMMVVTSKKLLGANHGFMVAPPFSTIHPEPTGKYKAGGSDNVGLGSLKPQFGSTASFQGSTFVLGLTIAKPTIN